MDDATPLTVLLSPGDLRTTGDATVAAKIVLEHPQRAIELVDGMEHPEPGVRMRCADALQKASVLNRLIIQPHTKRLIRIADSAEEKEVRWHCAQLLRVCDLSVEQSEQTFDIMLRYMQDPDSSIVRTEALETLAHLTAKLPGRWQEAEAIIESATLDGAASVRARGRKLLKRLVSPNTDLH